MPVLPDVPFQAVHGRPGALVVRAPASHGVGGIVEIPHEHTDRAAALEPVVVRAVDLHQRPALGLALPPLPMLPWPPLPVGDVGRVQPEPQRLRVEADPVDLAQFLGGMGEVEIAVLVAEEPKRPRLDSLGNALVRRPAACAVADASFPLRPEPLDQPPNLPVAQPNEAGGLSLGQLPLECLMQNVESPCFPSAHRNHVLVRHNALPCWSSSVTGHRTFPLCPRMLS